MLKLRDFDDFILVSPIIFGGKHFFFFLAAKNARILHKNYCERKLFYTVNDSQYVNKIPESGI